MQSFDHNYKMLMAWIIPLKKGSYKEEAKRGVEILISESVFKKLKEIKDKERRYLLIKGKLENTEVTWGRL